jgi:hypothetical protein
VKIVRMVKWVPEAVNTPEENDTLIAGVVRDLGGTEPGQYAISVCGDTLVYGVVEGEGQVDVFECTIRRVSSNVLADDKAARPTGPVRQDLVA